MSGETKKWINRGGLAAVIVGVAVFVISGGSADTLSTVVSAVGAVAVLLREILG